MTLKLSTLLPWGLGFQHPRVDDGTIQSAPNLLVLVAQLSEIPVMLVLQTRGHGSRQPLWPGHIDHTKTIWRRTEAVYPLRHDAF